MLQIDLIRFLCAASEALDMVERDLTGVSTHHSRRVACLGLYIGREMGLNDRELTDLCGCALLHDNALTEYIQAKAMEGTDVISRPNMLTMAPHCTEGEKNIISIPFSPYAKGAILYHHEEADGTGAFGKTAAETPLAAQIIHLTDQMDVCFDLATMSSEKYAEILVWLQKNTGSRFAPELTAACQRALPETVLKGLSGEQINTRLESILPNSRILCDAEQLTALSTLFARIIDYKSSFTTHHSLGIAEKAQEMGRFYDYDKEHQAKLYFAGSVHDIGKLIVDNDLLEKPGRLTAEEYRSVQDHALATYLLLNRLPGLEDAAACAYLHHEKLDGSGYPFHRTGDTLNPDERLLACLDIYQALVESRPYKNGMPHGQAMVILREMAGQNKIDPSIVEDIDRCFGSKN